MIDLRNRSVHTAKTQINLGACSVFTLHMNRTCGHSSTMRQSEESDWVDGQSGRNLLGAQFILLVLSHTASYGSHKICFRGLPPCKDQTSMFSYRDQLES